MSLYQINYCSLEQPNCSLLHMQELLKHPPLQSSVTSYVSQSSQAHHQSLLKAQMILLKVDLAAWLVYAQCNEYSN